MNRNINSSSNGRRDGGSSSRSGRSGRSRRDGRSGRSYMRKGWSRASRSRGNDRCGGASTGTGTGTGRGTGRVTTSNSVLR